MLLSLTIKNFVLISHTHISFERGLTVITGETGAGKSIILDALDITLGAKAHQHFVKNGEQQATITAEFDIKDLPNLKKLLRENDIEFENDLMIRRVIKDGNSKAYLNDQPVTIYLIKQISSHLATIQSQFAQHGLLDTKNHIDLIDQYAPSLPLLKQTKETFHLWKLSCDKKQEMESFLEKYSSQKQDFIEDRDEILALNISDNEEESITDKRQIFLNQDKIIHLIHETINLFSNDHGIENQIMGAFKNFDRMEDTQFEKLDQLRAAIERCYIESQEISHIAEGILGSLNNPEEDLEYLNDRLHRLRTLSRKHSVPINQLVIIAEELDKRIQTIDETEYNYEHIKREEKKHFENYLNSAKTLSEYRKKVSQKFIKEIQNELPVLKLEKAEFSVFQEEVNQLQFSEKGIDSIKFQASMNPGTPIADIKKIASGGELSRLLLALYCAIQSSHHLPLLVFDEIDTGVSGATANAIGQRIAKLAEKGQLIIITHTPQVAAFAQQHIYIQKSSDKNQTSSDINILDQEERTIEIARMLSASEITEESKAAAHQLLRQV